VTTAVEQSLMEELLPHLAELLVAHTEPNMLVVPALVAFKDPMIRGSAIHTAYRIFAAFFIVVGT
jgi:hypothetical protein